MGCYVAGPGLSRVTSEWACLSWPSSTSEWARLSWVALIQAGCISTPPQIDAVRSNATI